MKRKKKKIWLVCVGLMIICVLLAMVDIYFYDMSYIHGSVYSIVLAVLAIGINLLNYFFN